MTELVDIARIRDLARSGAARSVRLAAQLSLREVADEVGVAVSTLWRWEAGQRAPRGDAALRWAKLLDDLMKRS